MNTSWRLVAFVLATLLTLASNPVFAGLGIELLSPEDASIHPACSTLFFQANVTTDGEEIRDVCFYRNKNSVIRRLREGPWEHIWEDVKPGFYPIYAKVRGNDGGEAYSDTVYVLVGNGQRGDIIINGGFDCDDNIVPWRTSTHGTAAYSMTIYDDFYFDDATYLTCEIDDGSDTNWHIQLMQNTGLDSGHVYHVYFYADAEYEKTIALNWQENGGDWTVHWQQSDILIAGAEYYGPFEFACSVTDPTADFKFILGGNDIDIYLDSVSIIDLNATAVEEQRDEVNVSGFKLYPAFPNPFNMNTVIRYELPHLANVRLDVYNMQSKRVRTLESGTQAPGMHSLIWDGLNENGMPVSSGVYVYNLRADINGLISQKSQKIIVLK